MLDVELEIMFVFLCVKKLCYDKLTVVYNNLTVMIIR
jgi:hypothetical protein